MRGHDIVQSCWLWTDKRHWKLSCTCRLKLAVKVDCLVSSLQNTNSPETATCFVASIQPMSINDNNAIEISTIRTHTQQKCIITTVLSFITCWEWPKWGHPCLKTIKWRQVQWAGREKMGILPCACSSQCGFGLSSLYPKRFFSFRITIPIEISRLHLLIHNFFPFAKRKTWRLKSQVRLRQYTHKGTWSTWP